MTVTNTGTQPVEDWAFTFDFPHEITNIWNAAIIEHQPGVYTVKNLEWNQDIPVGGSINFGFTAAASGEITWPTFFAVNTKTTEVAADLIKVEYVLYSDWGSGYSAALKITNLSQTKIEDWTIDFDFARSIGNLSSGKILAHNGTHYTFQNDGYTQNLSAGQTIQLGLGGTGGAAAAVPTGIVVKQIVPSFDLVSDTDGDLVLDWVEICVNGTDPLVPEGVIPLPTPTPIEPTPTPAEPTPTPAEPTPTPAELTPTPAEPTPKPIMDEDIGYAYFKDFEEDDVAYDGEGVYYVKNQILISAGEDLAFKEVSAIASQYNAMIVGYIELVNEYQIEIQTDVTIEELYQIIDDLKENINLSFVSLNTVSEIVADNYIPSDPWLYTVWDEENPAGSNWGVEAIRASSAWAYKDIMNPTKIGLIDSYVETSHEDLYFSEVLNNDNSSGKEEHGTGVAGIMAASENSKGITGVCLKNSLYAYDIFGEKVDSESFQRSQRSMIEEQYAFSLLIGKGVKVINVSIGLTEDAAFGATMGNPNAINALDTDTNIMSEFFENLIDQGFDFLIVTSSGNAGNLKFVEDSTSTYGYKTFNNLNPISDIVKTYDNNGHLTDACVDANFGYYLRHISLQSVKDRIVCVGGMAANESGGYHLTDSSTRGSRVDIAAPGHKIYTTSLNNSYTYDENAVNTLPFGGTSAAAPFVAGAAGLIYSVNPSLTGPEVKLILISTADKSAEIDIDRSFYDTVGSSYNVYSLLDAAAAVKMALQSKELSGHRYAIIDESMTWDQAKVFCEEIDGHLVTITSANEQIVIEDLLTNGLRNSYWIGAEMNTNGTYTQWITGEVIGFTNYYSYQPDHCGNQEDVLQVYKNNNGSGPCFGYWNDLNRNGTCFNQPFFGIQNIGFICEWEPLVK